MEPTPVEPPQIIPILQRRLHPQRVCRSDRVARSVVGAVGRLQQPHLLLADLDEYPTGGMNTMVFTGSTVLVTMLDL